jgi:hypothetical protein
VNWAISSGLLPAGVSLNCLHRYDQRNGNGNAGNVHSLRAGKRQRCLAGDAPSTPLSLTINAAPEITTSSPLPTGAVGAGYTQTLAATGGTGPLVWDLPSGFTAGGTRVIGWWSAKQIHQDSTAFQNHRRNTHSGRPVQFHRPRHGRFLRQLQPTVSVDHRGARKLDIDDHLGIGQRFGKSHVAIKPWATRRRGPALYRPAAASSSICCAT